MKGRHRKPHHSTANKRKQNWKKGSVQKRFKPNQEAKPRTFYNQKPPIEDSQDNKPVNLSHINEESSEESESEECFQKILQSYNVSKSIVSAVSSESESDGDVSNEGERSVEDEGSERDANEMIESDAESHENSNASLHSDIEDVKLDDFDVVDECNIESTDKDPFNKHFNYDLHDFLAERLRNGSREDLQTLEKHWPNFGKLIFQIQNFKPPQNVSKIIEEQKTFASAGKVPNIISLNRTNLENEFCIKSQISGNIKLANENTININLNENEILTELQNELFCILNNYQDVLLPERTFDNAEEIRFVYCMHSINHILKTRIKILHHNAKIQLVNNQIKARQEMLKQRKKLEKKVRAKIRKKQAARSNDSENSEEKTDKTEEKETARSKNSENIEEKSDKIEKNGDSKRSEGRKIAKKIDLKEAKNDENIEKDINSRERENSIINNKFDSKGLEIKIDSKRDENTSKNYGTNPKNNTSKSRITEEDNLENIETHIPEMKVIKGTTNNTSVDQPKFLLTEPEKEYRDQGLVRPKVLILVPFRHSAFRIIETFMKILVPHDEGGQVINKKRFLDDFTGDELTMPKKKPKPEDYEKLFAGNIDDTFRIGISITKKTLKLYSDFYSSDIIIASPLGLRMIIKAAGEPDRDFDFLASIEVLIMDQTEQFSMQNWDHLLHLAKHLHLQPKDSHGTDFSRVRMWSINGWAKYYRQTLIFSSYLTPEINNFFNKNCQNYAGKCKIMNPVVKGSICQATTQAPHIFNKFYCAGVKDMVDARFKFFVEQVLPQYLSNTAMTGILIYVPSYFDYVKLRNYMKSNTISHVKICEYSKEDKVAKARDLFFHGEAKFLLYSERFHHFHRIHIKGIRHMIFYQLPNVPNFYAEMCNMMHGFNQSKKKSQVGDMSVTVLYSKFDMIAMNYVIGSERTARLLQSDRQTHLFTTED